MKSIYIIFFTVLISFSAVAQNSSKEKKELIKDLLNSRNYTFVALTGVYQQKNLIPFYWAVSVNRDSLITTLPDLINHGTVYRSVAGISPPISFSPYTVVYNNDFTGKTQSHKSYSYEDFVDNKNNHYVRIKLDDTPYIDKIVLRIKPNGNCTFVGFYKFNQIFFLSGLVTNHPEKIKDYILN